MKAERRGPSRPVVKIKHWIDSTDMSIEFKAYRLTGDGDGDLGRPNRIVVPRVRSTVIGLVHALFTIH